MCGVRRWRQQQRWGIKVLTSSSDPSTRSGAFSRRLTPPDRQTFHLFQFNMKSASRAPPSLSDRPPEGRRSWWSRAYDLHPGGFTSCLNPTWWVLVLKHRDQSGCVPTLSADDDTVRGGADVDVCLFVWRRGLHPNGTSILVLPEFKVQTSASCCGGWCRLSSPLSSSSSLPSSQPHKHLAPGSQPSWAGRVLGVGGGLDYLIL